ncbi:MAG: GNAT family N-acetyltransferase [Clostridiales bacterium]|nr:GNAT family N-acetyltransferase [Clostridiales bacterium]
MAFEKKEIRVKHMELTYEQMTHDNLDEVRSIDRSDIPESYVDTADTIMAITDYGLENDLIGHSYAVRADGKVIGMIMVGEAIVDPDIDPPQMQKEPFYRLLGFVIDRRYRGMGIGSRVMEEVIDIVYKDFGVRPISLGVHVGNDAAERFYLRHGFQKTEYMESGDHYFLRYPVS